MQQSTSFSETIKKEAKNCEPIVMFEHVSCVYFFMRQFMLFVWFGIAWLSERKWLRLTTKENRKFIQLEISGKTTK